MLDHYTENEESRHALQTIASFLEKRIKLLVETEFADRVAEFRKLAESRQQPHLTEQEQTGIVVEALLRNSIYYVVGTRCGLEISPENQDFSALSAFSSEEEIYCLGSLVSDVSCMVLRSVAKELAQVERGRIHDRGADLSQSRGRDVVSRPDSTGGRSIPEESRQVRSTGSGVSQRESPGEISGTRPVREAGGDHAGGGRGSEPDDGRVGRGLSETPSAERVRRNDGSVAATGAGEEAGRGNRDDRNRADLPLGTKKEKDGQLSFLLLPGGETNPPEKTLSEVRLSKNTSPVPPEYVRQVLLAGSGFTKGKQRIYNLFVSVPDAEERARRIKKEYGQGGAGWSVEGDGLRGYDTIGTNGIRFRWQEQGEEREGLLGWERVEQEIHTLIQAGEYYTPPVLLNPEQIAPSLWQEPLDRFFREMVREKMTDINWKEVLSGACPESYQIHLVEEACHPDRFLSFSQSRLENSYGPCAIECDRKGISVEFYNQDGKKGKIELDWQDATSYFRSLIQDEPFQAEETPARTVSLEQVVNYQKEQVERLKRILKATGKEEIEVVWEQAYDAVIAWNETVLWRGRQVYDYIWEHCLILDEFQRDNRIGWQDMVQLQKDTAASLDLYKKHYIHRETRVSPNVPEEKRTEKEQVEEPLLSKPISQESPLPNLIPQENIPQESIIPEYPTPEQNPERYLPEEEIALAENFHLEEPLPQGGPKTRYQWNLEAIRLLKQIEGEERGATNEEQKILARYVGWGGIPQVFDARNESWGKEYQELQELLTEEEYAAARESVNTAFYTDPVISSAVYMALEQFGFQGGSILEPSMGTGHFFGALPESLTGSRLYGIEKDELSGRIATLLYPEAEIRIEGFEHTAYPDNFFDVAVGNVPFGDFKLFDPKYARQNFHIHDYFLAKALDKVRPGGIVAFVTSKGTLDKANPSVRRYLAERAELIGAIRLPNMAFRESAGTDVTSDLLFLQKRDKKIVTEPDWVHLGQTKEGIAVNSYFAEHPEMMLGTMEYDTRMFGSDSKYTSCVNHDPEFDLAQALQEAIRNLQGTILEAEELLAEEETSDVIDADPEVRNYTYTFAEGKLYYRENAKMYRKELPSAMEEKIRLLDEIRTVTRKLIQIQTEGCEERELAAWQKQLNQKYDAYVKAHGSINGARSRRAFRDDADYPLLCSLEIVGEDGRVEKADMFYKQTIRPNVTPTRVETAAEALQLSISEYGRVNIPFMLELYEPAIHLEAERSFQGNQPDRSLEIPSEEITSRETKGAERREALLAELTGLIFLDPAEYDPDRPEEGWKTADEYLSGNVRGKLRLAKAYQNEQGERFAANVEALTNVQPKDLDASEIEVRIGTTWIEPEDYEAFLYELLQTPRSARAIRSRYYQYGIQIHLNQYNMNWFIENKSLDKHSVAATETYGTKRMDAYTILEESLNLRTVTVRDRVEEDGKVSYVLNKAETMLAREKQDQMKEAFREWIFRDVDRRQKYVQYYNETFNNVRLREYDGSYLTFPGMSPEIKLRKHQRNAVARILLGGNTLLAHCVGSGKTFTMMAACMEQKRLGLADKTVIVVPKPLIAQTAGEFLRLYPSANVLVTTERDFEKSRRKQFVSRIATGDYDCIIMSHSQFEKIPISKERKERMLEEQIAELAFAIEENKRQNGAKWTVKQMEAQKKRLEEQLKALSDESRKDDLITFEELGIDSIMVDEAHSFKNMAIFSKMNNVSGISSSGSQKAMDMQLKCQYITETKGNRSIVFATGTPVSNTMCELYVMQLYLQKAALERMGIHHFDSWAANFGEVTTTLELTVEGTGFRFKSRFNKFTNLPELMTTFREVADVVTADQIRLPVPRLRGGKPIIVQSEPDWYVKQAMEEFVVRAERIRDGKVAPEEDNFLKITHEARLLGTDARLLERDAPNHPEGKLNQVIERVAAEYFAGNQGGRIGCQLVFSDIGIPKASWSEDWEERFRQGEREFDVYNYLKAGLIKVGIPAEEIAFIHDAASDAQRNTLFQEMRSGKKKILIGSTDKCGTGVNVQTHLVAMHHIDCPWKPSCIEQRDGRGIRQGNENEEIAVYRYVTKGTFDAYTWALIENKQRFISQIMTSKAISRTCEDIDEATLSYAEIKAVATGNPLIKEKMQLENEVQRLKLLKATYEKQHYSLEDKILIQYPKLIAAGQEKFFRVQEDRKAAEKALLAEPEFSILIGKQIFRERTEGGTALLEAASRCNVGESTRIGRLKGFELFVEKHAMGVSYLLLRGQVDHKTELSTSIVGSIVKLENVLGGMGKEEKQVELLLEQYQRDLEQSKQEYQKPFVQEKELEEKTARLQELNRQLDLEHRTVEELPALISEEAKEQPEEQPKEQSEEQPEEEKSSRAAEPENRYEGRKTGEKEKRR